MSRIDHVNIVVADLERSIRFYSELLGLRRGFEVFLEGGWIETVTGLRGARARCVFMEGDDGATRLELLHYESPAGESLPANGAPQTRGLRHMAFLVDDLDALATRLRAAGVPLVSEPVTVPFAVADKGRKRLCYFHDPDGTLLDAAAYEKKSQ
jgi:catechol 2,3-dioxygenase-like lactoylglutathione lyase family enzyme